MIFRVIRFLLFAVSEIIFGPFFSPLFEEGLLTVVIDIPFYALS